MLSAVAATASLSAGLELLDLQSVPAWMQKDVHITHGYRSQTNSFRRCCHSLWYLHNESVNIWSHLLTGFCFLALLAGSIALPPSLWWPFDFASGGSNDLWALRVYLLGTTVCLFFSAAYHLIHHHSPAVAHRSLKLDYLGITANITATCISATHFGLSRYRPNLAAAYITFTLLSAVAAFWAVLDRSLDGPRAAPLRAKIFIALGASGFVPILHVALSEDMRLDSGFAIGHIVLSTACYLVGTGVYVLRFPERWWPGRFNFWGASHQIFHILVNCAQVSHLLGLWIVMSKHTQIPI